MKFHPFCVLLMCCCCNVLLLCDISKAEANNVVYKGPAVVNESDQFSLTCFASLFPSLRWRHNGANVNFQNSDNNSTIEGRNGTRQYSVINIKSALPQHSGNYKCSLESDDHGHNLTVIFASVFPLKIDFSKEHTLNCPPEKSNAVTCTVATLFSPLKITCSTEKSLYDNLTLAWYKSDSLNVLPNVANKAQSQASPSPSPPPPPPSSSSSSSSPTPPTQKLVKSEEKRVSVSNGEIKIDHLMPQDLGYYVCQVLPKNSVSNQDNVQPISIQTAEVRALPMITSVMKDMTVVEENDINLTCIVTGEASRVTWKFGNQPIIIGSDNRTELQKFRDIPDATLIIRNANATKDRGTYNCTAVSEYGQSLQDGSIYLRIKSKYAALGPFLGICAEVIVLCTIILIYEKKRDKTELEESDTDQGPETKSSPDHGQDSVRYRK